jgi:K+ transporter
MFIYLTLYVLASITKKREIVSAINPNWGFWWFNDKTNKGTNEFTLVYAQNV